MKENSETAAGLPEARQLAELQARMLRPAQEVNKDGSFELGWGTALLCFGLTPYFTALVTKASWFSPWMGWGGFVPLMCAAFASFAVPKLIKRFITWPRSGYVAHPNEVTLKQLVMLMIFGGALGSGIGLLYTLVLGRMTGHGQAGGHSALHHPVLTGIALVGCVILTVYLGRRVIRKRSAAPTAYDAAVLTHELKKTAGGRKRLRAVRFTLLAMFIGLALVVFGIVCGVLYGNRSLVHRSEMHWSQLGLPAFLVAANVLLYLMGSGLWLRPNRWKWLVLPGLLLAPILVAPLIPSPSAQPGWTTSPAPVILCLGTVWCLSGAIALLLFVRHNPAPDLEAP